MSIPTRAPIIQSPIGHSCVCCGKEHGGCCGACPRAVEYPELFGEKLPDKILGMITELWATESPADAKRSERLIRRAYAEHRETNQ